MPGLIRARVMRKKGTGCRGKEFSKLPEHPRISSQTSPVLARELAQESLGVSSGKVEWIIGSEPVCCE